MQYEWDVKKAKRKLAIQLGMIAFVTLAVVGLPVGIFLFVAGSALH